MKKINVTNIKFLDIAKLSNVMVSVVGDSIELIPIPNAESDYDRGMRAPMKKIAKSCGRVSCMDIGYESLPDLVESLVNSKQQEKPKPTKFVKVEESIFDLKGELEKGELYFRWLGNGEQGSGGVGYDKIDDIKMLLVRWEEKRVYRQVEVTERDLFIDMVEQAGAELSSDGEWSFACLAASVFDSGHIKLIDKPE